MFLRFRMLFLIREVAAFTDAAVGAAFLARAGAH